MVKNIVVLTNFATTNKRFGGKLGRTTKRRHKIIKEKSNLKKMSYFFTTLFWLITLSASAQQKTQSSIPYSLLSGTWEFVTKNGILMGEVWIKQPNENMYGKSYMVMKGNDTTTLELVTLVKEGTDIFYIPVTIGQNEDKPVKFKLTSATAFVYTFENPTHDFPKRIVYNFVSRNELHAYIDDGTENKRQHYYYKRKGK